MPIPPEKPNEPIPDEVMWTREQGQQFVSQLASNPHMRYYRFAIVGGILARGWSTHDLDIKVTPKRYPPAEYANLSVFERKLRKVFPKAPLSAFNPQGWTENIAIKLPNGKVVDFVTGWLDPMSEAYHGPETVVQWVLRNCKFAQSSQLS